MRRLPRMWSRFAGALVVMRSSVEAALALAIRRRETFLERTEEPPIDLDMRLLSTRIAGEFADLTLMALDITQPARWGIGQRLLDVEASAAVFGRAERSDAELLALFDAALLDRSVQETHYRFVWGVIAIKTVYDFGGGREMKREELLPAIQGARPREATCAIKERGIAPGDGGVHLEHDSHVSVLA
jgi:hypothetical protein